MESIEEVEVNYLKVEEIRNDLNSKGTEDITGGLTETRSVMSPSHQQHNRR